MTSLIRQTRISHKLLLISLTYSLPIAVMLYLIITGINKDINFARMETLGNQYQHPLEQLLESIGRHQILAHEVLGANPAAHPQLAAEQEKIDKAFTALETVDRQIGAELQFTPEALAARNRENALPATAKSHWQAIKAQLATLMPAVADDLHQKLIADVRTMITHA